jgi:alpha-L-arabinofuranosidase
MPVARIMQLYRHHSGTHALTVQRTPEGLDVVASRTGNTVFLHAVNTQRSRPTRVRLQVGGQVINRGRVFEIADDPTVEVSQLNSGTVMKIREKPLPPAAVWEFPSATVSVVELELA